MRFFLLFSLLMIGHFCVAQTASNLSWYKQLQGIIGQYPVTLHLHKADHTYSGFYYYHSQQNPVYFIGEDSTKAGIINLMLFADLQEQEELSFSLNGNDAKGTWKKTAGSKPLSFSAKEIT